MKKTLALFAAVLVVIGLASQARANLFDTGWGLGLMGFDAALQGATGEANQIAAGVGFSEPPVYLNKFNSNPLGWMNDGVLGSSYFTVPTSLGTTAEVSWNLAGSGWEVNYLVVKDGEDAVTKKMLYHFYGVTSDQTVVGGGTVTINGPDGKGISHISFFGRRTSVPDVGTTMTLMGMGLAGIGLVRRLFPA